MLQTPLPRSRMLMSPLPAVATRIQIFADAVGAGTQGNIMGIIAAYGHPVDQVQKDQQ